MTGIATGAAMTIGLGAGAAALTGAARCAEPYSSATWRPEVFSTPSSLELRRTSWMRPSPLASVRIGIGGCHQQGYGGDRDRRAACIRLHSLSGGKDQHILQHGGGHITVASGRMSGH